MRFSIIKIVVSFLISPLSVPMFAIPLSTDQIVQYLEGEWQAPSSFRGFQSEIHKMERAGVNAPFVFNQFGSKLDEFLTRATDNGEALSSDFPFVDLYNSLKNIAHDGARTPELRQRAFWTLGAFSCLPDSAILFWHSTEYQELVIRFTASDVPVIQDEAIEIVTSPMFLVGRYSTVDFDLTEVALNQLYKVWKQAEANSESRNTIQNAANKIRPRETTHWTENSRGNGLLAIGGRLLRCMFSFLKK